MTCSRIYDFLKQILLQKDRCSNINRDTRRTFETCQHLPRSNLFAGDTQHKTEHVACNLVIAEGIIECSSRQQTELGVIPTQQTLGA
ncbi:hypothetical protein WJ67_32800 [Burkholderia ubonensis]|nr:hypothetical protein WJ67_32800 [Burkholderia ubonensis]